MANDPHDNEADDRAMLRKLRDQETTMSNDDERDYDEEQYNRHLLDDETDPDERDTPRLDALMRDTSEDPEDEDPGSAYTYGLPAESTYTCGLHRAEALRLAGMAERSDPEYATAAGLSALTHAVLALSAPASREPERTWRQRAEEAEAALTAIGGIVADEAHLPHRGLVSRIEHVLRTSGREADRLMAQYRPDTPEGAAWKEGYKTAVRNLQGTQ